MNSSNYHLLSMNFEMDIYRSKLHPINPFLIILIGWPWI